MPKSIAIPSSEFGNNIDLIITKLKEADLDWRDRSEALQERIMELEEQLKDPALNSGYAPVLKREKVILLKQLNALKSRVTQSAAIPRKQLIRTLQSVLEKIEINKPDTEVEEVVCTFRDVTGHWICDDSADCTEDHRPFRLGQVRVVFDCEGIGVLRPTKWKGGWGHPHVGSEGVGDCCWGRKSPDSYLSKNDFIGLFLYLQAYLGSGYCQDTIGDVYPNQIIKSRKSKRVHATR